MHVNCTVDAYAFPMVANDENAINGCMVNNGTHTIKIPVGPIKSFVITPNQNAVLSTMFQYLVLPYNEEAIVPMTVEEHSELLSTNSKIGSFNFRHGPSSASSHARGTHLLWSSF